MDYLIGFLIGFNWNKFSNYLRKISDNNVSSDYEWDRLLDDTED